MPSPTVLRQSIREICRSEYRLAPSATAALNPGTVGWLQAPLAMTTARQPSSPRVVVTWYPSSACRTDVTLTPVRVAALVEAGLDGEPRLGGRGGDQLATVR